MAAAFASGSSSVSFPLAFLVMSAAKPPARSEIMKTYGPNEDTMLIVFCGKKICAQNRADIYQVRSLPNPQGYPQILDEEIMIDPRYQVLKPFPSFQLTRRILNSTNPSVRRNIIQKNAVGISALEKAAMHNKPISPARR